MDILLSHLTQIKIATSNDKVYKDECVFSFDNPETSTGLYVGLNSFIGLGRDYVEKHYQKTGESVFLHIKRERYEVSSPSQGDGPEKKITRLAIGVDGGFNPESLAKKFEFQQSYNIVILPSFKTIPWPNMEIPQNINTAIEAILDAPSMSKVVEMETLTGTWDGEARFVTQFANDLVQINNGKKIPPSGWKCEKCEKTDNLWLNLTDGTILCGRKFYDGSGGNNHAIDHYNLTGYPLAVKLGTISKDGKGDVFSYKEDDMVENPNLVQHLAHWGINIANMEKTEKSMVELELELNQKSNEWSAIQESDGQLKPIYGPGYTGMVNMGNSCYLNSVMQMLFSIPDFIHNYVHGAEIYFTRVVGDPCDDFNTQMAKLGVGLLSGKYSVPPPPGSPIDADPPGICPLMFKALVGRGHPEFSTKKQQDAQEFLLHLFTLLERNNKNKTNPGNCFQFKLEERFQCSASKKVKYLTRSDMILPLIIPLEAAVNKDEVSAYEAKKLEADKSGKKVDGVVRPKINFFSCLELFTQSEVINNFYSSAVNENVTARKTTKLATFPDYLCIQLKKFMLREDWVPIKLDVSIEMPDILDISSLRGNGPQADEELLPESKVPPPIPVMDEQVLTQLADMGFPPEACKRAVFFTHNSGLEAATAWIMEHITDSDFSDPFIPPGTECSEFVANSEALNTITAMGFTQNQGIRALRATDNNVERAMDWIFSHQDELENVEIPSSEVPEFRDGNGKYKLKAFISHMGSSTMVGHYLVHILKEGRWVIFNDSKVCLSENPPKDLGYMYLYERLQ